MERSRDSTSFEWQATTFKPRLKQDLHSDEPRLKRLFQKYPLLALRPVNVVCQYGDLNVLAVRDGVEEVKESADYNHMVSRYKLKVTDQYTNSIWLSSPWLWKT